VDLLSAKTARDAVALLVEADVPVADAVAVARDLRADAGDAGSSGDAGDSGDSAGGRVVETVRRSGKFGSQLKRLETAGFTGFVLLRVEDGAVVRGELRALGS
jgi:histidyl-tRNA synthetase